MNRRITVLGVGAVLTIAGLAGCTGAGASSSGMGTPSGGPSVTASRTAASRPPTGGGPAECTIGQLDISVTAGDAGVGHRSKVVVFRNTGSTQCVLQGYPGIAALDGAGDQVAQAKRTPSGYLGGVASGKAPLVNLAPGQSASATVEALAFGPDGESCTGYTGLLVTPPDETHSVRVAWGSDGCSDLQIHPVVPGTSGSIA
jgi:uncharacterized protein DUF4232